MIRHPARLPVISGAAFGVLVLVAYLAGAHAQDAGPPAPTVTEPRTPLPPLPPMTFDGRPAAPTPARRGYTADEWVRIIAELSVAIGAIGGLVVTITGNRAAAARDEKAARAAELRAEQLRAVATRVDAPVIAAPQPPVSGEVRT